MCLPYSPKLGGVTSEDLLIVSVCVALQGLQSLMLAVGGSCGGGACVGVHLAPLSCVGVGRRGWRKQYGQGATKDVRRPSPRASSPPSLCLAWRDPKPSTVLMAGGAGPGLAQSQGGPWEPGGWLSCVWGESPALRWHQARGAVGRGDSRPAQAEGRGRLAGGVGLSTQGFPGKNEPSWRCGASVPIWEAVSC